jgi:predicted porin
MNTGPVCFAQATGWPASPPQTTGVPSMSPQRHAHRAPLALLVGLSALASGPLHAQSSVKISGYLDLGVYRSTAGTWNVGTIQRSNLAFSGEEDLGDGLKATFKLSTRFDMDTGSSEVAGAKPFWHDESTVGLSSSSLGSVRVGRALDAVWAQDWAFDPWYNFDRIASPAWDLWHYNYPSDPQANNGSAEYGRLNNGVYYDSPNYKGFSVHLSGSPERRTGDVKRSTAGSLNYSKDGLGAMLSYASNSARATDAFFGLKGQLADVTLMGVYNVSETDAGSKAKAFTLSAQYTVGSNTFNAGWGQVKVDGTVAQRNLGLGVVHALSKRTSVYVDAASKHYAGVDGNKAAYGVGIAHSF